MSINDDEPVGRILSRREVLASLGIAMILRPGSLWAEWPACIARPEQTEGPYFVDTKLNRSDIRSDPTDGHVSAGVPLRLVFRVSRMTSNACSALPGALVDVWQCDAAGIYSGVQDRNFSTLGKQFLRGHQRTDASGAAEFTTIYPGWYPGRTVHIHFKIRTQPDSDRGTEFTSQLYFDDEITDRVHQNPAYARDGERRRNGEDGIYRRNGTALLLSVARAGEGYKATFDVGLKL